MNRKIKFQRTLALTFTLGVAWLAVAAPPTPTSEKPNNAVFADELLFPLSATDSLENGWANPPANARPRVYWWWLNGNVTKAAITRDLEGLKAKGFIGAVIFDAGGADYDGNAAVPAGPAFMSPEWRELFKHTLREADRLGLEISLNIQSGWNLGGPIVKPEEAAKVLTWSSTSVSGPGKIEVVLPKPKHRPELYHDVAVLACPVKPAANPSA